jgi:hypothetical protein
MAKLFAQIAGPRTYFVEKILTIGLSSLCLVVDAWAVFHTINGFYRITSVPWIGQTHKPRGSPDLQQL